MYAACMHFACMPFEFVPLICILCILPLPFTHIQALLSPLSPSTPTSLSGVWFCGPHIIYSHACILGERQTTLSLYPSHSTDNLNQHLTTFNIHIWHFIHFSFIVQIGLVWHLVFLFGIWFGIWFGSWQAWQVFTFPSPSPSLPPFFPRACCTAALHTLRFFGCTRTRLSGPTSTSHLFPLSLCLPLPCFFPSLFACCLALPCCCIVHTRLHAPCTCTFARTPSALPAVPLCLCHASAMPAAPLQFSFPAFSPL